jgi:hypothetical protein
VGGVSNLRTLLFAMSTTSEDCDLFYLNYSFSVEGVFKEGQSTVYDKNILSQVVPSEKIKLYVKNFSSEIVSLTERQNHGILKGSLTVLYQDICERNPQQPETCFKFEIDCEDKWTFCATQLCFHPTWSRRGRNNNFGRLIFVREGNFSSTQKFSFDYSLKVNKIIE